MNELFKTREVKKTYWAVTKNKPEKEHAHLVHWLVKNEKQNKSYASLEKKPNSVEAKLSYDLIAKSDNYFLLEVNLETGRHHQIRSQLTAIGCPIKGDLKYGSARSNPDGSIHLHARKVEFIHPVSLEKISLIAPVPNESLWKSLEK
jgi:23S rRNA pseudouridine1911/1915/1917 synthase